MFTTTFLPPALLRVSTVIYALFQKFLMLAGLVFVAGLIGLQTGNFGWLDGLKSVLPSASASVVADEVAAVDDEAPELPADATIASLNPRMRGALDYVSRHYHVSTEALQPIFATAQATAHELRLDPLLIIAVIGVESGFNPFSQSVIGAQGLMQVVPRFHQDKLIEVADQASFLDPVTNVLVGAKVLKESINRYGGLEDGLQQFGGAINDPERRYSSKVLAEKQRLEQAVLRLRTT
ncbi:MAG: Lytic transglycosylase, catalytic [Proteobacteria bacterium]|nr:Lytic transglycosylase, catalytic [Pseudomonadota bacterium]